METIRGWQKKPSFLQKIIFKIIARRSRLMKGLFKAYSAPYLDGMTTYFLKLPVEVLGDRATAIDRKVLAGSTTLSVRLRLNDMAVLLAEGLTPFLKEGSDQTLHLLNIGGGTAIDSLNALILIHKENPKMLKGRRLLIHLLDLQEKALILADRPWSLFRRPPRLYQVWTFKWIILFTTGKTLRFYAVF